MFNNYNPDVLSCLANLSNDEVFTPTNIANDMLDLLPKELWSDPNSTFLDPCCKTGIFLREIVKRLDEGLETQIPNRVERINHILKYQVFGIAITELTSLISRRSLYCSKQANGKYSACDIFDTFEGNVRFREMKHTWSFGNCIFCGANKDNYDRPEELESHAYEFIHNRKVEEIFNMRFDVIIGNPPYQLSTGGAGSKIQAVPLYNKFIEQAKKMKPRYLTMIVPSRWFNGGIGLNEFRDTMLNDKSIRVLVDYPNSKECFAGVDIAGGVNYFLWDRDNKGDCEVINVIDGEKIKINRTLDEFGQVFIRYNKAIPIIHKVQDMKEKSLMELVYTLDPFGFTANVRGEEKPFPNCLTLIHSQGRGYVKREDVKKNHDIIDKYKLTIGKVVPCNGEVGIDPKKGYKAITTPRILLPGEINTFSYMVLGAFDTKEEVENYESYIRTKFARFLTRLTYSSMNISKNNFMLVPLQDFNEPWDDEKLYKKYNLTQEEIDYIESTIRPLGGDDNE